MIKDGRGGVCGLMNTVDPISEAPTPGPNVHNGHDFGSPGANERTGLFSILHVPAGNEEKHYYIVLPANSLIFMFPAVSSSATDEDRMEEGRKCGSTAMWFSIAGAVLGIITIVVIMGDIVNKNEDYYYE